jgi:hypothetical protein
MQPNDPYRRSSDERGGGSRLLRALFGPIKMRGGQIQVWGCSPGCLILMVLASIVLTVLVNILIQVLL